MKETEDVEPGGEEKEQENAVSTLTLDRLLQEEEGTEGQRVIQRTT